MEKIAPENKLREKRFWEKPENYRRGVSGGAINAVYAGEVPRDCLVLEIGCGYVGHFSTGYMSYRENYVPYLKEYIGIDFALTPLKDSVRAQKMGKNSAFINADASGTSLDASVGTLPLKSESVDFIMSFSAMTFMNRGIHKTMAEAIRVLKHGGTFLFDIEHRDTFKRLRRFGVNIEGGGTLFPYKRKKLVAFDEDEIRRIFDALGADVTIELNYDRPIGARSGESKAWMSIKAVKR